jgi:hypothetical protein
MKSCQKFGVIGCKARHPVNPEKCLVCDTDFDYFAIDAEKEGKNIYQLCRYNFGGILKIAIFSILGFLVTVL